MRRSLIVGVLCALCAAVAAASPALPIADIEERISESRSADSPSVTTFVGDLRAELERAPSRAHAPARSLQEVVARLVPEIAGAPRCLTPFVLEIRRQTAASEELASYAAVALSPPPLAREAILTSADGHFAIHYTLDRSSGDAVLSHDRDGNGSPDYVDRVSGALVGARETIVTKLGFHPTSASSPLDVFLVNLGGKIDGYASTPAGAEASFVVLDSRLLGNDALLRAAVAHQYAHAVLARHAQGAPPWWEEATAVWLEGTAVGSFAHYTDRIQTALDGAASGLESDDARLIQGHMSWPMYLASFGGHAGLVLRTWENLEQQGDNPDLWAATDEALRTVGLSMEEAFSDYSLWLALSGDRSDGRHFPFADRLDGVSLAGDHDAYPVAQIQSAPKLAPLGAAFTRFRADGTDGGLRLRFEGDLPGTFQVQVLLEPRKNGAPLVRATIEIDSRGRGSIGIPWATFTEAILIVGNVSRGGGDALYSFIARSDPDFPFQLVAFSAESSSRDVRVTWETESEDGLLGWVVYRSDRTMSAARRVNRFMVPAIGDGDGPVSYQYVDDDVLEGRTYFYRLVGVTQEGLTKEVPETRVDLPR